KAAGSSTQADPRLRMRPKAPQGTACRCLISALGRPYPDTKVAGDPSSVGGDAYSLTMQPVKVDRSARGCATCGAAGRSKGISSMGNRNFGWPPVAVALSALALSACSTTPSPQVAASGPPEPEIPAHVRPTEIIGRWGYAAYHKPEDRTRTEANARGQCKQPYVIGQG